MELFLKGIAVGFIIAVPLGPVSVLCFRRVLTRSLLVGLFTIFGAAAADTIYGLVAAVGLKAVTRTLLSHPTPLRIFGGLFLLYFGIRMFRAHPIEPKEDNAARDLWGVFLSSFLMMLANPFIVISFFGVFAAVDVSTGHEDLQEAIWLGIGLFIGSSAWWLVYKLAAFWFGERLRKNGLHMIDAIAGSLICLFGIWQLATLAFHH